MRVNEGKLASVMICNPRQIFGGLWSFSSIVFYISLYLSPKSSQCNTKYFQFPSSVMNLLFVGP